MKRSTTNPGFLGHDWLVLLTSKTWEIPIQPISALWNSCVWNILNLESNSQMQVSTCFHNIDRAWWSRIVFNCTSDSIEPSKWHIILAHFRGYCGPPQPPTAPKSNFLDSNMNPYMTISSYRDLMARTTFFFKLAPATYWCVKTWVHRKLGNWYWISHKFGRSQDL
jgi:hypothetical protein